MRADETPIDRVGHGIHRSLRQAFPATVGEAIQSIYPPDAVSDDGLDDLIDRLRSIGPKKKSPPGGPGGGRA